MNNDLIVLTLDSGEEKEFYKLAEFNSISTGKNYIMFTDKSNDLDINNIYFNIINKDGDKIIFEKIESEEDKEECKKALSELEERLKKE